MNYTGETKQYTSKGQGNFNTVGAALGIASALGLNLAGENGLLSGLNGNCNNDRHHDHDYQPIAPVHYETQECAQLRTALAISQSEKFTTEQTKADLERLYVEIRREDEKLVGAISEVSGSVVAMSEQIGNLKGEIKGMQIEIERNREEGYRNLKEAKDYTNTRVDCLSQNVKSEIEKTYLWTQAQNYVVGSVKIDPNQICGESPIATGCTTCL